MLKIYVTGEKENNNNSRKKIMEPLGGRKVAPIQLNINNKNSRKVVAPSDNQTMVPPSELNHHAE